MEKALTLTTDRLSPSLFSRRQLRHSRVSSSPSSSGQKKVRRCNVFFATMNNLEVTQQWAFTDRNNEDAELAAVISACRCYKMTDFAEKLLYELKSRGLKPGIAALSSLMLCYMENGRIHEARELWGEIINSSVVPSVELVSSLVDGYARMGQFEEVRRILDETSSRGFSFASQLYSVAVTCFGNTGQLDMMELVVKDMGSRGFKVDSVTGNAFVKFYSMYGSIEEMEASYGRLKESRILIEKEAIRAIALAYIRQRKFYHLSEFLRDVGLGRRNTGNLLWNLLLLSYAANFKMKGLQREFLAMIKARFSPDLTTFNIRALAFSKMCLFWDLHLSVEHMKYKGVIPDLVTYGCIVDAYLDRRLGRNLYFVLVKLNVKSSPLMLTDPLVFEAFGKGGFHSSSESLLEARRQRKWTYSELVAIYLKKQHRSNQIFWNY